MYTYAHACTYANNHAHMSRHVYVCAQLLSKVHSRNFHAHALLWCTGVLGIAYPCQHLILAQFGTFASLVGVEWSFVVFVWLPLVMLEGERLAPSSMKTHLLACCQPSLLHGGGRPASSCQSLS